MADQNSPAHFLALIPVFCIFSFFVGQNFPKFAVFFHGSRSAGPSPILVIHSLVASVDNDLALFFSSLLEIRLFSA